MIEALVLVAAAAPFTLSASAGALGSLPGRRVNFAIGEAAFFASSGS